MRRVLLIIILCFVAVLLVCCGSSTTIDSESSVTLAPTAIIQDSNEDFSIKLVGVDEFSMTNGDKAVLVECVIENISKQEKDISSILCFTLVLDDGTELSTDLNVLNEDGFISTGKNTLDDHLYPNQRLQGVACFAIKSSETAKKLLFSPLNDDYWPDYDNSLSIELND